MLDTLPMFLKKRAERGYRYLMEQLDGVSAVDAMRGREPDWPLHRWGSGQNGSIAGIAWHVTAWKQITLPLLAGGGVPLSHDDLEEAPDPADWPAILAWLKQVGTAWNAELSLLPESAFEETRDWEGKPIVVAKLVAECYEHDIQHAAQVEHLRVRYQVEDAKAKRQGSDL